MRAPIPAALVACALALGVAASRADAQPHTTGAPDRYGYAPPDAQVPMARLRGRETAAASAASIRRASQATSSGPCESRQASAATPASTRTTRTSATRSSRWSRRAGQDAAHHAAAVQR